MNAMVPLTLDTEQGLTLRLYERGCALLEQCMTFDETKYWSSFSDAAIAWGKIHNSDRVEQLARALKLRAFRRLGELAEMEQPIQPTRLRRGEATGGPVGRPAGPLKWLERQGMDRNEAMSARMLGKMNEKQFTELTQRKRPPLPTSCRKGEYSPWQQFYMRAAIANAVAQTSRFTPTAAANLSGLRNHQKVKQVARGLATWFGELADILERSN